jgi:hypothetical protein
MKRVASILLSGALSATGLLLAADFWEKKAYLEWKKKETVKLLTDSPWADEQAFGSARSSGAARPGSSGGGGQRSSDFLAVRKYFVRFQSAVPVRMALAQSALLNGKVSKEEASEFVETEPAPGYVMVVLSVPPGQDRTEMDRVTEGYLKQNAYLLLEQSGRHVYLEGYLGPSQNGSTEAHLFFPRTVNGEDVFKLEEKEVRFICELNSQTRLNRKFSLEKMIFKGELEI